MGDLAPAGSRAVVVVDNLLSQTGRETFKGENYTLQRNEDGDIANTDSSWLWISTLINTQVSCPVNLSMNFWEEERYEVLEIVFEYVFPGCVLGITYLGHYNN